MVVKGNDTCPVESCIRFQHVHMRKLDRIEGTNNFPTSDRFNP